MQKNAKINIFASGSEVSLAVEASKILLKNKIMVNVISVPCMELYKEKKLIENKKNIFVEAATSQSWDKWMKQGDIFIGLEGFGASGPGEKLYKHFGITTDRIVDEIKRNLN